MGIWKPSGVREKVQVEPGIEMAEREAYKKIRKGPKGSTKLKMVNAQFIITLSYVFIWCRLGEKARDLSSFPLIYPNPSRNSNHFQQRSCEIS